MKKIVLFILALMPFVNSFGQWSGGSLNDIKISNADLVNGWMGGQSIVSDGHEGTYMAWSEKNTTSNWNVFVQHVGATGFLEWNNVPVGSGSFDQLRPYVIRDEGACGGMIVAWQDKKSGSYKIYAQKYSWVGLPLWTAGGVLVASVPNDSAQKDVSGISDGNGGVFLTWRDFSTNGSASDIYAQRLDDNGAQQWGTAGIAVCTANGDQSGKMVAGFGNYTDPPFIIHDNAGGIYVVWSDGRSSGSIHVYGQRIDGAGTIYWTANGKQLESQPSSTDDWGLYSVVSSSNNDFSNFIFVYSDYTGSGATAPNSYVTKIDQNGSPLWGINGKPLTTGASGDGFPDVDSDGQGGALATWWHNSGGQFFIYASKLDANGNFMWGTDGIEVSRSGGSNQYSHRPRIRHDGDGGAHITWGLQQGNLSLSNAFWYDIYANCIDASGVLLYPIHPNSFSQSISGFPVMNSLETNVAGDTSRSNFEMTKEGNHTVVKCLNSGYLQSSTNSWITIQAFDQCQLVNPNNLDAYFYYSSACAGDSAAFTNQSLGSATAWNWNFSDPASGADNTSTLENPKHKFNTTGTYSVTLIASVGVLKDTIVLNVCVGTGGGVIDAGPNITICKGSSTVLDGTGSAPYSWSPATGLSSVNVNNPTASPTVTTNYILTALSAGCSSSDSVLVSVNNNPLPVVVTSVSNITICSGSSTPITASGATAYSWSPSTGLNLTNGSAVTASPPSTIIYTVVGTDVNDCTASATVVITVELCSTTGIEGDLFNNSFKIYPNPTNGNLTVTFNTTAKESVIIRLTDMKGDEVYRELKKPFSGEYKTNIDLSKEAKGIYMLNVITDKGIVNRKIVVE